MRSKHSWPVIIMASILFLLSALCSTFFLFAALYHSEWLMAGLIVVLGFSAMTLCYGVWTYQTWAWYAVVCLLAMSTVTDILFSIFKSPYPALIRGVLTVILLGLFITPKTKGSYRV